MNRTGAAIVAIALLMLGCTPKPRFTNPAANTPVERQRPTTETTEPSEHKEKPANNLSRVDSYKMNQVIAKYMSTPYQRGGSGVLGLDCSGFVYVVYRDYDGTRLPLTVQSLYRLEDRVEPAELSYGDLVFFRSDGRKVSHVGIYIGDGKFVHASETRGVAFDDLTSDAFAPQYAGARRIK